MEVAETAIETHNEVTRNEERRKEKERIDEPHINTK